MIFRGENLHHEFCSQRLWNGVDVNDCARYWYFQVVPFITLILGSLIVLGTQLLNKRESRVRLNDDSRLFERRQRLSDRLKMTLEAILLVTQCSISLLAVLRSIRLEAASAFWLYCLSLVGGRLTGTDSLWAHSTILYTVAWFLQLVPTRTSLVFDEDRAIYVTQFALTTLLVWATWTTKGPISTIENQSPEMAASLYEQVTFAWMNRLLNKGYQASLNMEDMDDLVDGDHAGQVHHRFKQVAGRYTNILWPTLRVIQWNLTLCGAFALGNSVLEVAPAMLVKVVLNYIDDPRSTPLSTAWSAVMFMFLTSALASMFMGQALYRGTRNLVHVRGVLVGEIYSKALRRKVASSANQASTGSIINLMSIDAFKLSNIAARLQFIIGAFFQISLAFGFLFYVLGWSSVAGLLACVVTTPLNTIVINKLLKWEYLALSCADKRAEKLNEVIQCIKIIKYFAWEDRFGDQVRELRKQEFHALRKRTMSWIVMLGVAIATPMVITGVTFITYTVIAGNTLNSTVAFTALSLLNLLRSPIEQMNDTIGDIVDAQVSLKRLNKFINEDETGKFDQEQDLGYVGFENASFEWGPEHTSFKLRDMAVKFPRDKLSVVCGATGSGKTSLLMALLGEMTLVKGQVSMGFGPDGAAYCAQQAWLLNDTIKNNILFSSQYDEHRYHAVVEACALTRDLEILDAGDQTEVGDKGIALSGGQKQRISLARALYSKTSTLLLDDCLSAVDSDTADHIYNHCLTGPLMLHRTVVLVSHNVELTVSKAEHVVIVRDGRVFDQGSPDHLSTGSLAGIEVKSSKVSTPVAKSPPSVVNKKPTAGKLVKEEERASGAVSKQVYTRFLGFMGRRWFWLGAFGLFFMENLARNWTNVWVRNWALAIGDKSVEYYMLVYVLICASAVIITMANLSYMLLSALSASQKIFESLLESVLHANTRFFDSTPIGRIMNRFGKDVQCVDMELPTEIPGFIYFGTTSLVTLGLISFIAPFFLVVAAGLILVYATITAYYMASSREIKRLDSVSRSPIFQHFGQTLSGVATIRAYKHDGLFQTQSYNDLDYNSRAYMLLWGCNRWLYFRITFCGALVTLGTGAFILLSNGLDSGLAGLALVYAMTFNGNVIWTVRMYAEVEMKMNSVERTTEWIDLPSEPHGLGADPQPSWPQQGAIEFQSVALKYAPDLPRVIDDVSFKIEPGTKVGIIGRTGAGKSTLMTALLRCLECDSGRILIDGVDIATLNLKPLRRSLAIIPQDPTLFAGTIRSNLDPFDEFTDLQMFESLQRVHLLSAPSINNDQNTNAFENLDSVVTELGQNLSQGQRQLLCMARALLRKPKILLLDEATASIDYETDAKIQQTIREEFAQCTLMTIAHRIKSVMDYDKLVVFEKGRVIQHDTPHIVMAKLSEELFDEDEL